MSYHLSSTFVLRGPFMALSTIPKMTKNKDETQKAISEHPKYSPFFKAHYCYKRESGLIFRACVLKFA